MKFKITYEDTDGKERFVFVDFEDFEGRETHVDGNPFGPVVHIKAQEFAEDYAYMLADKGWYKVEKA